MDYYVHNTSRETEQRVRRYTAPSHRGLLQFLGTRRILRGRPLVLGESELKLHRKELSAAVSAGLLTVKTADGRVVDLDSGEVLGAAPKAPPLPVVVLDSAKNDLPSGRPMPIYPGGAVQSLPVSQPEPPPAQMKDDDDDDVEVEHTEPDSGAKRGKKGRR